MATRIRLPSHNWQPRPDQKALWNYLYRGGLRAVEIAHRRWGKDEIALHMAAIKAHQRAGGYWHMLPQAAQARKAIWDAINPRTGRRRIDDAFPMELRESTRETDMFIRFKSGASWQVVGSDNYNSLMGTPPVGITFSEYALADPNAWAYLRPILEENGGWALFITTPRGRNHAHSMLELARTEKGWFGEVLDAHKTPVFTEEQLDRIHREMVAEYGEDDGDALFSQEYLCSFDAPLVGAYYAKLLAKAEQDGRFVDDMPIEPSVPVETAWDLGYSDDTVIWWFQVVRGEVRVIDFYENHGEDVEHYCDVIKERGYNYGDPMKSRHWVPWDAQPKTLASGGKSIIEQAWAHGVRLRLFPNLSVQDGIQAVRQVLPLCWFDRAKCKGGLEALRNYQREWDEDKRVFKRTPLHNWASHPADGFRGLAIAWKQPRDPAPLPKPIDDIRSVTMDQLWKDAGKPQSRGMI